ncbi:MAG: hypothetical protein ACRC67_25265 [Inquilinus sp.]|uniref:hypothetical protein n=1 Tax=Inquilinus sp. TaxID=1932117 RepID=UPI003F37F486
MVGLTKELGYGARVGAMRADFGTTQETGIRALRERHSHIELGEFLRSGNGPKHQALPRLIGSLVEVPPFA